MHLSVSKGHIFMAEELLVLVVCGRTSCYLLSRGKTSDGVGRKEILFFMFYKARWNGKFVVSGDESFLCTF